MPQWTADFVNDPNNNYELMIEIRYGDEDIGVIKHENFKLKFVLFSHNKDITIPFNWLLKLMKEADKELTIKQ